MITNLIIKTNSIITTNYITNIKIVPESNTTLSIISTIITLSVVIVALIPIWLNFLKKNKLAKILRVEISNIFVPLLADLTRIKNKDSINHRKMNELIINFQQYLPQIYQLKPDSFNNIIHLDGKLTLIKYFICNTAHPDYNKIQDISSEAIVTINIISKLFKRAGFFEKLKIKSRKEKN